MISYQTLMLEEANLILDAAQRKAVEIGVPEQGVHRRCHRKPTHMCVRRQRRTGHRGRRDGHRRVHEAPRQDMTAKGNFIAGEWCAAASGATFDDRNLANRDDLIARFPDSAEADVVRAVGAVAGGWRSWAAVSRNARAAVPEKAAAIIAAREDDIACELVREEGKTLDESRNEAPRIGANFRLYAAEIDDRNRSQHPRVRPHEITRLAHRLLTPVYDGHRRPREEHIVDLARFRLAGPNRRHHRTRLDPGAIE